MHKCRICTDECDCRSDCIERCEGCSICYETTQEENLREREAQRQLEDEYWRAFNEAT